MKQRLSAVTIGQCAFTCLVVLECLKRGVKLKRVFASNRNVDHDPFGELVSIPEPAWLIEHRFYRGGWRDTLKRACQNAHVEHVSTDNVFSDLGDADVLLVAGLAAKVPDRVLSQFGDYALNVHTSLLPKYRGPQPEAQVILHGEVD